MKDNCEINNECQYWDVTENACCDEEVYINPENGETCCRYLDGAVSEEDYREWYETYEEELWDDID